METKHKIGDMVWYEIKISQMCVTLKQCIPAWICGISAIKYDVKSGITYTYSLSLYPLSEGENIILYDCSVTEEKLFTEKPKEDNTFYIKENYIND